MEYDTLIQKTEWYKVLQGYKKVVIFGARKDALTVCHSIEYMGGD